MTQIKLCQCDMPGCESTARVPELGVGNIRCPSEWCEMRAFPPGENRMLSAHVCPTCWASKILPLFQAGFERDQQRQEDIEHRSATGTIPIAAGGPAWLSGSDVARLKSGATVNVEGADVEVSEEDEELARANARRILLRAQALHAVGKSALTWEGLSRGARGALIRRALDEMRESE
jgi:hypothetical protein